MDSEKGSGVFFKQGVNKRESYVIGSNAVLDASQWAGSCSLEQCFMLS